MKEELKVGTYKAEKSAIELAQQKATAGNTTLSAVLREFVIKYGKRKPWLKRIFK